MILLEGKKIKEKIMRDIKKKVKELERKPTLAVISTNNDPASMTYINSKKNMCEYVGYDFRLFKYNKIKEEELISLIEELNNYDDVDSILLQLPLNKNIDTDKVINYIDYKKDVDGITDINMGRLMNDKPYLSSATALGIMKLFEYYKIELENKNIVILGRSRLVGRPLASMLLNEGAKVTVCHSKTKNIDNYTKNADILIVGINKQNYITKDMIKDNCIIVDVGIHKTKGCIITGDVDYESVKEKVSYITPVPGGVGQLTIAMLCENIYKSYILRNNK